MRLSRRARYAVCGIFDLAYNGAGRPVRVAEIGGRQGIPIRFLEQIFRDLRLAGLVTGKRGPGGGYVLARPAHAISLRQVVEAIEGPLRERDELDAEAWAPSSHRPDFLWADLSDRMAGLLAGIALSDLCREAARRSIDRVLPDEMDFQI